jgi:hypothetical protein
MFRVPQGPARNLPHLLGYLPNGLGDAEESLLAIAPSGDGFGMDWQGLEPTQLRGDPVGRLKDNRNHPGFALIMTLESSLHLDVVAIT